MTPDEPSETASPSARDAAADVTRWRGDCAAAAARAIVILRPDQRSAVQSWYPYSVFCEIRVLQ